MTREEAEEYANNMTYRDAINNLMKARSIPYRKATFIKVNELLKTLEQEPMRDATPEEQKSVDDYIKSISKPTGINFWDLVDGEYISREAVIDIVKDVCPIYGNDYRYILREKINELPTVAIPPEHDGCKDCKYETYPEYYYPCCECKQNYMDEWKARPKEESNTGHWIWQTEDKYQCSCCGEIIRVKEVMNEPQYIVCPMCGAKMGKK